MNTKLLTLIAVVCLACVACGPDGNTTENNADVDQGNSNSTKLVQRRFLILLAPGQDEVYLIAKSEEYFGSSQVVEQMFPNIRDEELQRMYLVSGPAQNPSLGAWDAAYAFLNFGEFERVEPDQSQSLLPEATRSEALGACVFDSPGANPDKAWSLRAIRAGEAWQLAPPSNGKKFGEDINICHPDTGYMIHDDHDSLDLTQAWNVMDNNSDALDPQNQGFLLNPGHGTATGSVIASRGDIDPVSGTTGPGSITGVAPAANVVPIRTVNSVIQLFDSDVAQAVAYSANAQCDVISMSLGGRMFFGLRSAVRYAASQGLIIVAAAGNCVGFVVAPAIYDETVAVAATNDQDIPWDGSSRGRSVSIAAPGEGVWNANKRDPANTAQDVSANNGTSFAAAEVAGAAALWLAYHGQADILQAAGSATVQELFQAMLQTTARVPSAWDGARYGAGILDAEALLQAPLSGFTPVAPPVSPTPQIESVELLARLSNRPAGQVEQALKVMLAGTADFETSIERLGPELMEIALRDPKAFENALNAALTPPGAPSGPSPAEIANKSLESLASESLRAAMGQ